MTEISTAAANARLRDGLMAIASRAAAAILAVTPAGLAARQKRDLSPVTAADEASEAVILEGLARLAPGVPILSEESAGRGPSATLGEDFFVVDPLDGTKELLAGRDEYTVNIAFLRGRVPWLGVVSAPARGLMWCGLAGAGAERLLLAPGATVDSARERRAIGVRQRPTAGLVALVSRSHLDPDTEAYLTRFDNAEKRACGSSLKFCALAEGSADLYPRLAPTSEWDVAAGHALLTAAGGIVTAPDGRPLAYGSYADYRIPAFVARGDCTIALPG